MSSSSTSGGSWISNLNVDSWVKGLIQKEKDQIDATTAVQVSSLKTQQTAINAQLSTYGQINNLMQAFQQSITALNSSFCPTYTISSSNTQVAIATPNGTVTPGTHSLNVQQLASASSVGSANTYSVSTTTPLGMTNSLTFSVGSGATNFTVPVLPGDSLQAIANNINTGAASNSLGINATVITNSSGNEQLIVRSTQTGLANQVNISETGTGSNALGIAAGSGGSTAQTITPAQDALFGLDQTMVPGPPVTFTGGLTFDFPTNSNIIEGMSINLQGLSTNANITLSVLGSDPVATASSAIQNTVSAYNALMTSIDTAQASSTAPDLTLSLLQSTIEGVMTNVAPALNSIGISLNTAPTTISVTLADGKTPGTVTPVGLYTVNTNVNDPKNPNLITSLTNNFSTVQSIVAGSSGVFATFNTMLTANTPTGTLWNMMNDATTTPGAALNNGAIPRVQQQLASLNQQITTDYKQATTLKDNLVKKYAELDLLLGKLQGTSNALTAELSSLSSTFG